MEMGHAQWLKWVDAAVVDIQWMERLTARTALVLRVVLME